MTRRWLSYVGIPAAIASLAAACGDDETTAPTTAGSGGEGATTSSAGGAGTTSTGGGGTTSGGGNPSTGGGGSSSSAGGSTTSACSEATCDIDFSGSGFGAYDGDTLYWGLVEQGSTDPAIFTTSGTISSGGFSFSEMDVTEKGKSYYLNYYVDVNANGNCDINTDAVFRIALTNVQEHHQIHVTYDASDQSNLGCAGL